MDFSFDNMNNFLGRSLRLGRAAVLAVLLVSLGPCAGLAESAARVPVKVLLLPKFEIGQLTGDLYGEAQHYYDAYLKGGDRYEFPDDPELDALYVKDGVALGIVGIGKVTSALSVMRIITDPRFDFSSAYVISTGCAGSSVETTVMGDVIIVTAAVDYDMGHHIDGRQLADREAVAWFADRDFLDTACVRLDPDLITRVYELVKDIPLETTEETRRCMSEAFKGAEWAVRSPRVQKGTTVTSDNYWKGVQGRNKALKMVKTYGCPDPYALTEMEDAAVGTALKRLGMLDRYIIVRVSVNMDEFMNNATPESLWGDDPHSQTHSLTNEGNAEAVDIFATAMENNFRVGRKIVDAILAGKL